MAFTFELKNTEAQKSFTRANFPLFRFSNILKNLFLVLFLLSFLYAAFSSGTRPVKMVVLFFCLYLVFWNLNLFTELKIKKTYSLFEDPAKNKAAVTDASLNPDNYNLAEYLDLDSVAIVNDAVNFCRRKKIPVNSTALLYSAIRLSKDVNLICIRLGIDEKKLQVDIKNYLEKMPKIGMDENFSDDFAEAIKGAYAVASERGKSAVGEKEMLTSLASRDEFFKKVLVDFDLKPEDVENLTFWLDSAEHAIEDRKQFWKYENLMREGSLGKDFSSGYTMTLDRFSIDWRRIASKMIVSEIVGHTREIEEVEVILSKPSMSGALIIGEADADRKSIITALARKCYLGTSLPQLNNKRVIELDAVMLATQISDFEKLESVLDEIFSEVLSAGNIILVIDNLDNFVGQKVQKAGSFDLSGVLSKYLPLNNFKCIGLTSLEGLHKNLEEKSSFVSLFEKVEVAEVTEKETISILQTTALELEYADKILVLYPSIREIVNLTSRYMPSLPFPKKALDILNESAIYVQRLKERVVLPHHIAEIISKKTDIPVGKMEVKEKEVLLNLENLIHGRIVNQEEAVSEISIAMRRARMGIASKTRPMGTFLFLGPTGVGKTETAKALAQIYFGSEKKMITLDMSEFQAISDIPRIIGATSPVEMQGLLTTPVRETPFSLVLLDEIEKAHPNILNLLLQVLDEGRITDGQGRKVVFTSTIIICTSNAGADMIFKAVEANQPVEKDKLLDSLFEKNIFRPEFVNRFDATVIFHPLTRDNLLKIAQLSMESLQKNLKEKDIDFIITDSIKEKIVDLSYKPEFGAREMRRIIQDKVENVFAQALLSDAIKKGDRVEVNAENFQLLVNPPKQD